MNVSLTPQLEEFIRRKVASGLYNNASEVIRESLRLLISHQGMDTALSPQILHKSEIRKIVHGLKPALAKRGVISVALFGSHLHGNARPDSDIDLLIETDPKKKFSLVDLSAAKGLLEEKLGRSVDVVTRMGIDSTIRQKVFDQAEIIF